MQRELKEGDVFQRHKIVKLLGAGGMGEVYQAIQPTTQRDVAMKIILAERAATPQARELMVDEAMILARLNHRNIVQVLSADFLDDGTVYIVMELLSGETLRNRVATSAPLPIAEALFIAIEAGKALAYGHKAKITHRDIKPENIFITGEHDVKVLDYGIAKLGALGMKSTRAGRRFGTPAYSAPEQLNGGQVGPWSDIYSLSTALYEMLTGRHPFATGAGHEGVPPGPALCLAQEFRAPRAIEEFMPELAQYRYVLEPMWRGLYKNASERYGTMAEFVSALQTARSRYVEEVTRNPPKHTWPRTQAMAAREDGVIAPPAMVAPPATTEPMSTLRKPKPGVPLPLAPTERVADPFIAKTEALPDNEPLPEIPPGLSVGAPNDPRNLKARRTIAATRRLARLDREDVRRSLVAALRGKRHPAVRAACADALAVVGNVACLDPMRAQLAREPNRVVRARIEAALVAIGRVRPVGPTKMSAGNAGYAVDRAQLPIDARIATHAAPASPRAIPSTIRMSIDHGHRGATTPPPLTLPADSTMDPRAARRRIGRSLALGAIIGLPCAFFLAKMVRAHVSEAAPASAPPAASAPFDTRASSSASPPDPPASASARSEP